MGPVLVATRARPGFLRVRVEAEVQHRADVDAEQPRDRRRHDELVRARRIEHAARADRDAIRVDVEAADARVGADLEVRRCVGRRRELRAVRAERRRVEAARRRYPLDVRQVREPAENHRVVARLGARQAVHRGGNDQVGRVRAPQERRVRRLRAASARDRAHGQPAEQPDQQGDRDEAAPPAVEGRPEPEARDAERLPHHALAVSHPARERPRRQPRPRWGVPPTRPRPLPAPSLEKRRFRSVGPRSAPRARGVEEVAMRMESSVTSLSWIPSEAVTGVNKPMFEMGIAHYDDPPPDVLGDLDAMAAADAFRFANRLRAWVDVEGGRIVGAGYGDGGVMGSTTVRLGGKGITFAAVELPQLRDDPVVTAGVGDVRADVRRPHRAARAAARAASAVRAVPRAARLDDAGAHHRRRRFEPASRWPARACSRATGCTTSEGKLAAKVGLADFKQWYRRSFGRHTPWGSTNSTALVTAVETALERELAGLIMRGGDAAEDAQAEAGRAADRAGRRGRRGVPRARRRARGRGRRRAARRVRSRARSSASGPCWKAACARRRCARSRSAASRSVRGDQLDREALEQISQGHRREEAAEESGTA